MNLKLCSFLLFILFWMYVKKQRLIAVYVDSRFVIYKRCLEAYQLDTWKLLGSHYNGSFYEQFNFRFNKLIEKAYPIAILTPTSPRDVQIAVLCGVRTNTQLVPISGGHSYAGLSFGTNDSISIDFRYMNDTSINHEENVVSVESGTLQGHLYGKLWKNGGLGASLGVGATVAMGGLAIGGGIGYFSTHYGLVIDNLVEINMVDARGEIVRIDESNHADLWWAMRGVGPGYIGLVTSVKLKVFNAEHLKLTNVTILFKNDKFKNVMGSLIEWLDWVKENDPNINTLIKISRDEKSGDSGSSVSSGWTEWQGIEVQLLKVNDPRIGATSESGFINASRKIFPKFVDFNATYPTFIDFVSKNSYAPVNKTKQVLENDTVGSLDFLSSLSQQDASPRYFKAQSFFVKKPYSAESMREAQKIVLEIPNISCGIVINSEQGEIGRHRSNESAYVHRDALFNFKVYLDAKNENGDHVEPCTKWMEKFLKSVEFLDSGESYQNYPERHVPNYLNRFYGSNLERLTEIKREWDPNGYFNSEMSIPID